MKIKHFLHILLFTAMITLYSALSWGTVLMFFWDWFIIPMMAVLIPSLGILKIGFIHSVVLFLFLSIFRSDYLKTFKNQMILKPDLKQQDLNRAHIYSVILSPWIVLLVGMIVKFVAL